MQTILTITDWVLFALLGFATAYLFIFALASMRRRRDRFPAARIEHRMAVLIPAYREDRVIDQSVEAILAQQYPRERYEAVVIADHCAPATLERLCRSACWKSNSKTVRKPKRSIMPSHSSPLRVKPSTWP